MSAVGLLDPSAGSGGNDGSVFPNLVIWTTILVALALGTYLLRIHIRLRPRRHLRWDDHAMTVAMLLTIGYYGCQLASFAVISGQSLLSIPAIENLLRIAFVLQWLYLLTSTMVKVSVVLMIQRIKQERHWQRGLYCLLVIIFLAAILNAVSILVGCHPIRANWKVMLAMKPGACQPKHTYLIMLWVNTGKFSNIQSSHFVDTNILDSIFRSN
jgi:rhodopsin domain-containing protein